LSRAFLCTSKVAGETVVARGVKSCPDIPRGHWFLTETAIKAERGRSAVLGYLCSGGGRPEVRPRRNPNRTKAVPVSWDRHSSKCAFPQIARARAG
jgi:hypothetical protein